VTARGTDINVIATLPKLGPRIRWAAEQAAAVIAVADSLRDGVLKLGIDPTKVVTLRNGVDSTLSNLRTRTMRGRSLGSPPGHC
jgi:teichuronic acid biosynthesis glycosyltransferase TuaC